MKRISGNGSQQNRSPFLMQGVLHLVLENPVFLKKTIRKKV